MNPGPEFVVDQYTAEEIARLRKKVDGITGPGVVNAHDSITIKWAPIPRQAASSSSSNIPPPLVKYTYLACTAANVMAWDKLRMGP